MSKHCKVKFSKGTVQGALDDCIEACGNYAKLIDAKNKALNHVLYCIANIDDKNSDWNWATLGSVIYQHREMYKTAMKNYIDDLNT